MRILVTGEAGQVARSLAERGARRDGVELIFARRPDFDLGDEQSIRRTVEAARPDVVINAAAFTAVDQAEDEPEAAERLNARAPGILAAAAQAVGARMIHISTDYVFDGTNDMPYSEDMPTNPLGVYGRTKLAGEEAVRAECADHLIVRTAWVYSPFGRNFVKTMLGLAETRDTLSVVDDQVGNPTCALDLADGLIAVVEAWRSGGARGLGAVVHLAGTGATSWAGVAEHVLAESRRLGGPSANVVGIASEKWPTRAKRPANSRLDSTRFKSLFGYSAPPWPRSASAIVARLVGPR